MKAVALLGMPFLYQSGDREFHLKMLDLGLSRGTPLLCGLKHKAIIANSHEYFLADDDDEKAFCEKFDLIPTYTVYEFIKEIERIKNRL